jgi:RNA polymerase sigma factor (sigma-70 family)
METRESFDRLLVELRPKLHRYCARFTGSVIDGEDVVQEALVKAIEAFGEAGVIANPEGWLFRIAHNAALDFLRRRARREAAGSDRELERIADPVNIQRDRQIAATSLRTFMRLPVAHRSSVILMDVLGYSLREISGIMNISVPAVKAALHRGRVRLRELADEPEYRTPPVLSDRHRSLLAAYVDRFNARYGIEGAELGLLTRKSCPRSTSESSWMRDRSSWPSRHRKTLRPALRLSRRSRSIVTPHSSNKDVRPHVAERQPWRVHRLDRGTEASKRYRWIVGPSQRTRIARFAPTTGGNLST